MKRFFFTAVSCALLASPVRAQVYINELLANPPGSDSSATTGFEFFELRGAPNLSLLGYYLLSLEGQGTTGRGDVNQYFDLNSASLGANGFLIARPNNSSYSPIAAGATSLQNTVGQGWGTNSNNTIGYQADGSPNQLDLENSATTILLVNIGSGAAPTLSLDLDSNDDGFLDLPVGWTVADSVGLMDGVSGAATDFSYGAITFRVGGLGASAYGNIIDVPGAGTSLYVGRKGDSAGSTSSDWVGSILSGSAGNFSFGSASDASFNGLPITIMQFGATNAPEPSAGLLIGAGLLVFGLIRRRR